MPGNLFIKFDGIDGESFQKGYETWSELSDMQFGVEADSSWAKGGGASVGKPQVKSLTVSKYVDLASTKLFANIASGKHIPTIKIVTLKTTGTDERLEYLTIELTKVFLTDITVTVGEDGAANETLSLAFAEIKISYAAQLETGKKGKSNQVSYNIPAQKVS